MALIQADGTALVGLAGRKRAFIMSANLATEMSDYLPAAWFFCTGQTLSLAELQQLV
jgi:hypothetical protein